MSEQPERNMFADILATTLIIGAIGEGMYELFHWLQHGVRAGVTLARILIDYMHVNLTSIYYPTKWFDAARIFRYIIEIDLWFFLLCLGLSIWYVVCRRP